MNLKRTNFTYNINSVDTIISSNWFIGFLEGEGTFGTKTGSSLYFQVAQKNTSYVCLNSILKFLSNLESSLPKGTDILPLNILSTTNTKTNVVSLVISSVDGLYYYILPLLDKHTMYTFKGMSFKLWRIALLLKIEGYYLLPEGRKLFLDISDILNNRYSTGTVKNVNDIITEILKKYDNIKLIKPPFDINLIIPHTIKVRNYTILNKISKSIYIYSNGNLIKGSPFNSYSNAHKALGLNPSEAGLQAGFASRQARNRLCLFHGFFYKKKPSSNTCNRYIDTNKLYKSKYLIRSEPIDSISTG
uniref:hypothetical protein n=1 Tax=Gonatophragmium mori TaxID=2966219 RepID=UPI0023D7F371|nr:hypothetical protein P2Z26_mgp36 [Gonatophragmium mori]WCZ71144.1 hypothetical protein [Gonatophragmium mori]